jgi:hypothetical protein
MADPRKTPNDGSQPGVLGDQTEEQNLGQPGNPKARITKGEVEAAFGDDGSKPGVLGDQTEEQNLGQPGNPKARITKAEVQAAFGKDKKKD